MSLEALLLWALPGRGDWFPPGTHLDLITLLHTLASPGPDDSGPHLGLNLDLVTVVPTWVSPGPGVSRSHMTTPGLGDCGVLVDSHLPGDSGPH